MGNKAIVAGATGLVGKALVQELLQYNGYEKVIVLVRRALDLTHPRLEQHILSFDQIGSLPEEWFETADIYCTLGTTIKKAKSREQFAKVDYEYPLALGRKAVQCGSRQLLVITALGASERSLFFYSRVKGKLEHELARLQLPSVTIFQPSLIIGMREEHRRGEELAASMTRNLSFLFKGKLSRYKPIEGRTIAAAMLYSALEQRNGLTVVAGTNRMEQMANALWSEERHQ
ncbi:SDR family oxidoreductase [Paenibacillus sp. GXUN7292]|uniref:SDR family oxidoreductase n=1 Tax=Paenibacillus sp. GXUN7292 TaxID=3422499 RepID=UPI003D7D7EA5